ncbi:MAG: T9SS type A sorting domain-containing protein, partial [Ignavibacteria bacterium]|nr:T9SS type A sorting domain-containing protein [Ignavibacteria bacterium]
NTYYYRLKQIDNDGMFKFSDTVVVNYVSSIRHEANSIAGDFFISQNYPNPFNPSTTIDVSLRERGEVALKVYDLPGNLIYEKNYGEQFAGKYKITLDAKNWSSGIYIYQVITGEYVSSKPMILLK